jgi:hypothetical protein
VKREELEKEKSRRDRVEKEQEEKNDSVLLLGQIQYS